MSPEAPLEDHFRVYLTHKPETLCSRKRVSAKDYARNFFDDTTNPYTRKLRVGEVINHLEDAEFIELELSRVLLLVSPVDFRLKGFATCSEIYYKFETLRCELLQRYPEGQTAPGRPTPPPSSKPRVSSEDVAKSLFIEIASKYKEQSCKWLLSIGSGDIFRNYLMPHVLNKEYSAFLKFSCAIVGSFAISQKGGPGDSQEQVGESS